MWSSLPYIYLFCVMILLILSINTMTAMSSPILREIEDTDEQQQGNNNEASGDPKSQNKSNSSGTTTPCWETENFTLVGTCTSCHPFSSKVFSDSCEETGFNQLVHCLTSNQKVYKSCPRSRTSIEKSFWIFEGVTFIIGLFFSLVVFCRRRKLNREAAERVRKQISNSV